MTVEELIEKMKEAAPIEQAVAAWMLGDKNLMVPFEEVIDEYKRSNTPPKE